MFAVIFRAKINKLNPAYSKTAQAMREIAMSKYGCTDFIAVTEGDTEIAVSYWKNEADIKAWKQDSEHLAAQQLGRETWYASYHVQVVKILREYSSTSLT